MIFRGTADGRLIALDAKTGTVIWDRQEADPKQNESFVAAPIAWNGKVFLGIAISDLGISGRIIALGTKTGGELWHFHTVPEPHSTDGQPRTTPLLATHDQFLGIFKKWTDAGAPCPTD